MRWSLSSLLLRLVASLAGLVLVVLALVVLVLAALQSEAVRGTAENAVNAVVPGVTIEGLQAGLPSRFALRSLVLDDKDGPWLEVAGIEFVWAPAQLLNGRAVVQRVGAERVRLRRLPPPTEPDDEETPPLRLPEAIFPFHVEQLGVDEIVLDEPVLGQAARLRLDGAADGRSGTRITANIALERLDRTTLEAGLEADLDLATARLELALGLRETSGLLAGLANEPRLEPFALDLRGTGPLADWQGTLAAEIGSLADLSTTIALSAPAPLRIGLDGALTPRLEARDGGLAELLTTPVRFALDADVEDGVSRIERLSVAADWLQIDGNARLSDDVVQARLQASAPDLKALEPVAGTTLAGELAVDMAFDGPLPVPPGTLTLSGDDLVVGGTTIAAIDQRLTVEAVSGDRLVFALDGAVQDIAIAAGGANLQEDIRLTGRGSLVPGGPFAIESLALDGQTIALDATADGDLAAGVVDAVAQLQLPQLAAFRAFSDAVPQGSAAAEVRAQLTEGFGAGAIALRVTSANLDGLPPPAGALLGSMPTLGLDLSLAPLPRVVVEQLALDGEGLTLDAAGEIALDTQQGTLTATADVPSLAPVGAALDQQLAGSLTLNVDAQGDPDDFAAELQLQGDSLGANDIRFDEATLALTAGGSTAAVDGDLDARLARDGEALSLVADYAVTPETIALDELAFAGPGARLDGTLSADLARSVVTGSLEGGAEDLRELGVWLGLPLGGSVTLDVALADNDGQAATARARVRDLQALGVGVAQADVALDGNDLMGDGALDASLTAGGITQGTTRLDELRLDVDGTMADLAIDLEASGGVPDPFTVAGGGSVRRDGTTTRATLDRLTGALDEVPVRLVAPATVRLDGGTIELDGLELEVDTARLNTRALLTPERVDGRLDLTGLDLARLEAFGGPALVGQAQSTWTLAGSMAAPRVDGELLIDGFALSDGVDEALRIAAEIGLAGGRLDAAMTATGLGEPALRADATMPLRFALEPFVLEPPDPLPLDARLAGRVDLARLAGWAGLDGQEVRGRLDADVTAAGTADEPVLDGLITTEDVSFVDVASGVLIEDIELEVGATRDVIELRRLSARDGREGTIEASGDVRLGDGRAVVDLSAAMTRFAVVQQEDLFIEMSGDLTVRGGDPDVDVEGRFTVNRGDVTIPSGSGAQGFATLDVKTAEELREAAAQDDNESPAAGLINLDVAVDVPGRLFVRGRGLVSEWEGAVEITGDATRPNVVGLIEYRRGHISVLRNRFEFRKGEIRFTGDFPPEPFLDVEATVPAGEYLAILAVRGAALDPEISVESEPPLPQDEVLARLLFDQEQSELNSFQALALASSVRELQGGRAFGSEVRSRLGLDTLDVGGDSLDSASLRGGVYVNESVFLELEQGLEPNSRGVRVEVELTPRLNAETRVNQDQTSSVGLRWGMDY